MRLSRLEQIAQELRNQVAALTKVVDELERDIADAKAEPDPFAAHYFASRKHYRKASERAGKSGNGVERELRSSYIKAQEFGFMGSIRDWETLLRIRPREL